MGFHIVLISNNLKVNIENEKPPSQNSRMQKQGIPNGDSWNRESNIDLCKICAGVHQMYRITLACRRNNSPAGNVYANFAPYKCWILSLCVAFQKWLLQHNRMSRNDHVGVWTNLRPCVHCTGSILSRYKSSNGSVAFTLLQNKIFL